MVKTRVKTAGLLIVTDFTVIYNFYIATKWSIYNVQEWIDYIQKRL